MLIGTVTIGPHDHWEIRGKNVIWIWQSDEIVVLRSDSRIMSLLIREYQERNTKEESYENGAGI
jgi:hypothetical protein